MKYKLGLVLGRFQLFHFGHEEVIDRALELCDKLLVFIGSADKSRTFDNPYTYEERKKLLTEVYGDKIIIKPLNDLGVGNVPAWGQYVLESATKALGRPDCIVFGEESKCYTWFDDETKRNIHFEPIKRSIIDIDGTRLRRALINNDKNLFIKYTNPSIHKYYDELRDVLINVK